MTLDEFLAQEEYHNQWVHEPGFDGLYVRRAERYIKGSLRTMLDLANVTATKPGSGAFTNLVGRLLREHPKLNLYVECVKNPRFAAKLVRMGFEENPSCPGSFYLERVAIKHEIDKAY